MSRAYTKGSALFFHLKEQSNDNYSRHSEDDRNYRLLGTLVFLITVLFVLSAGVGTAASITMHDDGNSMYAIDASSDDSGMVSIGVGVFGSIGTNINPPIFPMFFYGNVTIDGEPAPDGTTILAKIDGEVRGSTKVVDGRYGQSAFNRLIVNRQKEDERKIVRFYIDSRGANENASWHYGDGYRLDLTFGPEPIDTIPPEINSVTLNDYGPVEGQSILVTINATDNVAVTSVEAGSVSLAFTGGDFWSGMVVAVKGEHYVKVSARDAAGHVTWNNSTKYNATDISPPIFPMFFYGNVIIDGEPAPGGTILLAKIDGEVRGNTMVVDGRYGQSAFNRLIVNGQKGDEGKIVRFYVDSREANENTSWHSGDGYQLDLTFGIGPIDPIPPVINSVTLDNYTPVQGQPIDITVNATDNVAVTGVESGGVPLSHTGGDLWNGTIMAVKGEHYVNVSAVDAAGNIGWNNSTSYNASADETDPVINSVILDDYTPVQGQPINITVNATDNVAVTGVESGGVPLSHTGGDLWNGTIMAVNGEHYVNVSAVDAAGNIGWNNSTSYNASADETDPVINSVTLDDYTPVQGQPINITVNATDHVAITGVKAGSVSLSRADGADGDGIWTGNITALFGTHFVNVSATDAAGNIGWDSSTSYTAGRSYGGGGGGSGTGEATIIHRGGIEEEEEEEEETPYTTQAPPNVPESGEVTKEPTAPNETNYTKYLPLLVLLPILYLILFMKSIQAAIIGVSHAIIQKISVLVIQGNSLLTPITSLISSVKDLVIATLWFTPKKIIGHAKNKVLYVKDEFKIFLRK